MKSIDLIKQGFCTIFNTEDALVKHIGLFAITGVISLFSVHMINSLQTNKSNFNIGEFVILILIALLVGAYLNGYNLQFTHNIQNNEGLPDIDQKPIAAVIRSIPLSIVWMIYLGFIGACIAILAPAILPLSIILCIFLAIFTFLCYPFIFVIFAKHFDTSGLFNPAVPFKFINAAGLLCAIYLCMFIINYVINIPIGLIGVILGLISGNNIATIFVGAFLGGYAGFIIQLVISYCLVQIYKEKFDDEY